MDSIYTIEQIKSIVAPIAKAHQVGRIYLFGSYARGQATAESDIDLRVDKGSLRGLIALCLLQIGELTIKLTQEFKDDHPEIPWRAIRGMRNVVAHEYGKIDTETAENGTLELKAFCQSIISSTTV